MARAHPDAHIPTAPTFTGALLDRAMTLRHDPEWVARLLEEPTAVSVAASADGVLVRSSGQPALLRRPVAGDGGPVPDPDAPILLGIEDGAALFAVDLEGLDRDLARGRAAELTDADAEDAADTGDAGDAGEAEIVSLRDAGAILPHAEAGLAAYLMALLNWHRKHRFCANCGSPADVAQGGYSRHCPNCGASHFPRTDPVVIMLVEHDRRLLLGRRVGWPETRYSVLAGFVSPGETLEEAVVREVREESGIEAYDAAYVASQPWPFPSSLMLGFTARSDGGEPMARDGELEDVRWVTLEQVLAARNEQGELRLPPPISIARFLIEGWVARARAGG
jgi:NAD+ diphosphatase